MTLYARSGLVLVLCVLSLWYAGKSHAVTAPAAPTEQAHDGFLGFLLDPEKIPSPLADTRPTKTNDSGILASAQVTHFETQENTITLCHDMHPVSRTSYVRQAADTIRLAANNAGETIEAISVQPHFSGLKGPKLVVIRRDVERALLHHQGSSAEIYHNARQVDTSPSACFFGLRESMDVNIRHRLDLFDTDQSPLYVADALVRGRLHLGGYFMASLGVKVMLYQNLENDPNLFQVNRNDPIRKDFLAYNFDDLAMDHLLFSGFFTPKPDWYLAGHLGYVDDNFAGLGLETLYRPRTSPFSIGADIWATYKRDIYGGHHLFGYHPDQRQVSALVNGWYDMPDRPISLGLSAGRFLDGDYGIEGRAIYKPAPGWRVEGFAAYSTETDQTLSGDDTHLFAGIKLTMPLGLLRHVPEHTTQTVAVAPLARDKAQRIHNPYPLYDLTDPWATQNLYRYWGNIAAH